MKLTWIRTLVVAACLTVVGTGSASAVERIYVVINGANGTPLPTVIASAFTFEMLSPRDAASGLPTGKRIHKPITFTKEWGQASPQLWQALTTNELLRKVEITFTAPDATGKEAVTMRVTLNNVTVSDIRRFTETTGKPPLEEISLVYQKITIDYNTKENPTERDDWVVLQ